MAAKPIIGPASLCVASKAIASLSDEEKNSLQHLQHALEEWKVQKNEIKLQLDTYRRALSGSGFDFEKAMKYRELIDEEKTRLDKAVAAIECHGVPGLGSEFRSSLSTPGARLVPSPTQQKEALARIPSCQLAGFGFDKASHRRSAPRRRTQVLDQVRPSPLAQPAAARHPPAPRRQGTGGLRAGGARRCEHAWLAAP